MIITWGLIRFFVWLFRFVCWFLSNSRLFHSYNDLKLIEKGLHLLIYGKTVNFVKVFVIESAIETYR